MGKLKLQSTVSSWMAWQFPRPESTLQLDDMHRWQQCRLCSLASNPPGDGLPTSDVVVECFLQNIPLSILCFGSIMVYFNIIGVLQIHPREAWLSSFSVFSGWQNRKCCKWQRMPKTTHGWILAAFRETNWLSAQKLIEDREAGLWIFCETRLYISQTNLQEAWCL